MRKLLQQDVIDRCKLSNNDKYNYNKTIFTNTRDKFTVICPNHGEFSILPTHHMRGVGCNKCAQNIRVAPRRSNKQRFVRKAVKIHGDKYDYSKFEYINNRVKGIIIDKKYNNEFLQTPRDHLHGKGNPYRKNLSASKRFSISYDDFVKRAVKIHGDKYIYTGYEKNHIKIKIICPDHGEFYQKPNSHLNGCGCPKCSNQFSRHHEYIKTYLLKNNIKFEENKRDLISPFEVDFFLPNHNIAIEINGIYWHSELRGKDHKYHLNKLNLCKEKGVRLIHINENEFLNHEKTIVSKLNSILNINKYRIYGRKCEVREIDSTIKSKFLNKYHIQGNDKSSVNLGLFYKNRLVSVMTFCKRRVAMGKGKTETGEYELSRFCNNFNFSIIGGAGKLLKYFERNYNPSKIITYADKRWSVGELYLKLGFTYSHDSKPNYWYFQTIEKLYHRFNFRKSELLKKIKQFDPNLTEWENMKANGWNRIWDCGNMVFVKTYV